MANMKRDAVEKFIISNIEEVLPKSGNAEIYKDMFAKMSDSEFSKFIEDLESRRKRLFIIAPNMSDAKLDVGRNFKHAARLGRDVMQHLVIPAEGDSPAYITPEKYPVMPVYLRRQSQLLVKKASIPKSQKSTDALTGQPVNKSKGSSISAPELDVLVAKGLTKTAEEFMKYRGGDTAGLSAFNASFNSLGSASMDVLETKSDKPESAKTLSAFLKAMHIENNM